MEYQHGGDIYSQDIQMDYSANINPLGMPETVKSTLRDCLDKEICSLYPDSRCRELRQALGRHHGVEDEWVICGNGAADLIFGLAAALRPGRGLVPAPTFSEYEQALKAAGCRTSYYYLREDAGFAPDISGMCSCIKEAAERGEPYDIVFLCNPNNPTGIPAEKEDVEQLAQTCGSLGAFLVVDECFCDFLEDSDVYSVIPDLSGFGNLFVLKAFTKLYAMAGLRLGYGLCSDRCLLERLQAVRQPWSVSGLAQRAGVAALSQTDFVEHTRAVIKEERERLAAALRDLGFKVYSSGANYLFFRDPGEDGTTEKGRLYQELLQRRILIRSCANYPGLDSSCYRICVKLKQDNEQLIREMARVLERRKSCPNIQNQS